MTNTLTQLFTPHLFSRTSVETPVCSPAASTSGCFLTGSLSTCARLFGTVRSLGSTLGLFGLVVIGAFFTVFFLFFSFLPRATFDIFLPTAAFYAATIHKLQLWHPSPATLLLFIVAYLRTTASSLHQHPSKINSRYQLFSRTSSRVANYCHASLIAGSSH